MAIPQDEKTSLPMDYRAGNRAAREKHLLISGLKGK
jgi:hypothetical protein